MDSFDINLELAALYSSVFSAVLLFVFTVCPLLLKLANKNSLADFVNTNDSKIWKINLINKFYYVKSYFINEKNICSIDTIIVYPIKSIGKGLAVKEWKIGEFGLMYDRHYVFAAFNEKKNQWIPITLRERSDLINVAYELGDNSFVAKFGDGESFEVPMKMEKSHLEKISAGETTIQLWSVPVIAHDVSSLFPKSFVTHFNLPEDTKLFFTEEGHPVKTGSPPNLPNPHGNSKYRNATFQDYYPLLILSRSDLANMDLQLEKYGFGHFKVSDYTFRPNIIVEGELAPHDEDSWYRFVINTITDKKKHFFTITTKCGRCMVPNIRYTDVPKMDKGTPVTRTLAKFRRVDVGNRHLSYFGVYAIQHDTFYTIKAGDTIDVLQRRVSIFESGT